MKKVLCFFLLFYSCFCSYGQQAGFTYSQDSKCVPSTIIFTNTSTGSPSSVLWNFGDNSNTSTNYNPTHPYANAGVFTVTLIVWYTGFTDTVRQTIEVYPLPTFDFVKSTDSICPGGSISFTTSISYPSNPQAIQSYVWDFGDGGTDTVKNPTYTFMNVYNLPSNHQVSLTITDTNGCVYKETKHNYIFVHPNPEPDFVALQYYCYPVDSPAVVNFTNTTGKTSNNTYQWMFSDGQSSTLDNPTITFQRQGNYSVSLSAVSPAGCTGSISKVNFIQIGTFNIRDSVSDTIICSVPGIATFQGLNGMNTDYFWDFGDGTIDSSVSRPISHIYHSAGTYQVTVMARHSNRTCLAYDTFTIHVYEATSAYPYTPSWNLCNPQDTVVFTDSTFYTSSDDWGLGSVLWEFGDNTSAYGSEVSHLYAGQYGVKSSYFVQLSITTPYGCKLKDTAHFLNFFPIQFDPVVNVFEGCAPLEITATRHFRLNITSSPIVTHIWYWDSTTNSIDTTHTGDIPTATHTYTQRGVYQICMTVINEQGCIDTFNVSIIRVGGVPAAGFTYESYREECFSSYRNSPFKVYPFDSVDVYGNLIGSHSYSELTWLASAEYAPTPPAPNSNSSDTVDVIPNGSGYISVTLTPYDLGCPGNTTIYDSLFYVCPPIAVGYIHCLGCKTNLLPYYVGCGTDTISFFDASIFPTSIRWHFGDAAQLNNQSTDTAHVSHFRYYPFNSFIDSVRKTSIYITLIAINDDSVDVNSPTFNRCGYCEDTTELPLVISMLEQDFSITDDICQNDTIVFYDSTTTEVGIIWKRFALEPMDTAGAEYTLSKLFPTPEEEEEEEGILEKGYPLFFYRPNIYAVHATYRDSLYCDFTFNGFDTVYIYPGNIVSFSSSLDGVNFHYKKDTLCLNYPDTLYLKDMSYTPIGFDSMSIIDRQWIIAQDTFNNIQNPVFFDTVTGLFDVSLRLVNEHGCVSMMAIKDYFLVNKIIADFVPMERSYCNKSEVEFINFSYVNDYEFNKNTTFLCTWDFGDGSPPYTQIGRGNVKHFYNLSHLPDTIDVTLTVSTNEYDCSETYTTSVIITGVIADFTTDKQSFPCPSYGRGIQFDNTTIGNPVWFYWNFGDTASGVANESSLKDPTHDYMNPGTYDVLLIVENPDKCRDTLFIPEYIFIDGPTGDFLYDPLDGCVEHRVVFIPSVNNTDTLIVNPDRATPITSGGIHLHDTLEYVYTTVGSYVPYFYLIKWIDNNGIPEQCIVEWAGKDTVHVIELTPDFEIDSLYCPEMSILFKNTSVANPVSITLDSAVWDFGNNTILNSINGITQYDTEGFYDVHMIAYAKSCQKEITKTIEVLSFPYPQIYPDSANGCVKTEAVFYADSIDDLSKERITQYRWIFDDGEIIEGNPIEKNLQTDGYLPYQLELTFTPENCYKIYYDSIFVLLQGNPTANFEAKPQPASYGEEVQFTDMSSPSKGKLVSWYWNLGDNSESDLQNPSHRYDTSGKMSVLLKIEDEFGCLDSIIIDVLITESLDFPNIFTPTGKNGEKYVFRPMEDKGYFKEFKLEIYNRWGNSIWSNSCTEPDCPGSSDGFWWDGHNKWGQMVEDGVYYWVVFAAPASEIKPFIKNGSVTVIHAR